MLIMPPKPFVDPKDLSVLLFGSNELDDTASGSASCIHPSLVVSKNAVLHGRGLVVTDAIKAGTCLFVTPAMFQCDKEQVRDSFLSSEAADLAEIAEQSLLQAMRSTIDKRTDWGAIRCILALIGGVNTENLEELPFDTTNNMQLLLGNDKEPIDEDLIQNLSDDVLLQIIRRNAFGPDFCTYDSLQSFWTRHRSSPHPPPKLPPHLLGMYPLAAMMNHSCVANAVRVYVGEVMVVHAGQDVAAGDEVVWSYLPPTMEFHRRQKILQQQHGFVCKCQRCRVEEEALRTVEPAVDEWNDHLVNVAALDSEQTQSLFATFQRLNAQLFGAESPLSNEAKRYLRVGYTYLHMNYLNATLAELKTKCGSSPEDDATRDEVLAIATQLHFSFCACHNASTEDLSILHLCYDLVGAMHQSATDQSKTLPKLRFWTEQLKKAHMIRYGKLGCDVESVRKCMMHTKAVLRQKDGLLTIAKYHFI
ncbi:hypothetical protein MPSEU_000245000 [Mayamaea pseudoterrestris]|nr:hypothetical protein MPSEU_000245000 [Mayamaea pseudoterrestris]